MSIKRHKDVCATELLEEVKVIRRDGLLGKLDKIDAKIERLEKKFADNPQTQVQLIARQLEALDKEAKLLGAYTNPQENAQSIAKTAQAVADDLRSQGMPESEVAAFVKKRYDVVVSETVQ